MLTGRLRSREGLAPDTRPRKRRGWRGCEDPSQHGSTAPGGGLGDGRAEELLDPGTEFLLNRGMTSGESSGGRKCAPGGCGRGGGAILIKINGNHDGAGRRRTAGAGIGFGR